MKRLFIDIETYSATDIRAGVYRYTEDPAFQILMAAWSADGDPVQIAVGETAIRAIPGLQDRSVQKVAHNAQFERICFSRLFDFPVGKYLAAEDYHCTQAVAGELGYPQSLKALAVALGADPKDEAGTRLISLFCKPNRKGQRVLPEDKPEEWAAFIAYCKQDVVTLVDVDRRLGGMPTDIERAVYLADQRINDRGMRIDVELAVQACEAAEDNRMVQELEISELSGVANPGSTEQMGAWLRRRGIVLPNLRAETVDGLLAGELPNDVRRVLELRQELALVASKKFTAALAAVSSDGRLRGGYKFFGAHTGRWAGKGVQPHNLPRASLESEAATEAAILDLKLDLGADAHTLKALVRALFWGPFTVVDYAAIEARVLAWLAGESWALQAFRDGRDIYVETAERMGGLTRSQGKVAVLALGFNGGINSLRVMGAQGDDPSLQYLVTQWRRANPSIVSMWSEMEKAFRIGGMAGEVVTVEKDGSDRWIRLPSGRSIGYHNVRFTTVDTPYGPKPRASFDDPKRAGTRTETYGGRLVENVTQAVARDVLAEALVRLERAQLRVAGHVHDEIIVEGTHRVETVSRMMSATLSWAPDLPLDGAGFTCDRYRKD